MPDQKLCYVRLESNAGELIIEEHELTRGLDLPYQPDDARLRIALAELSGNPEPLLPQRLTSLEHIHLIWLQSQSCLALPKEATQDVEAALVAEFGSDAVELVPDGWLLLHLTAGVRTKLRDARYISLNGGATQPPLILTEAISIRPWGAGTGCDLLLEQGDRERLEAVLRCA